MTFKGHLKIMIRETVNRRSEDENCALMNDVKSALFELIEFIR